MAKKAAKTVAKKTAAKQAAAPKPTLPKVGPGELQTVLDHLRYAVSRFQQANLAFAHGTTDPISEAAFLIGEALHLRPEQFETFATARVTLAESRHLLDLVAARVTTRKPAAYLVNKVYMRGLPFYVDERVIVPRSFIGELLESHFGGNDAQGTSLIDDALAVESVLDLCTGSGCLAILASRHFPNATIDAVDISRDALAVAARNVAEYGLEQQISLHRGDLFAPLAQRRYELIISNPPYVDAEGMASLPPECRAEPALAFDGGDDGLTIIHRILEQARDHLTAEGGLLCEVGRDRPQIEAAYPDLPLLWLDTEDSEGEVFWIAAADLS
jgi:ribosomal protein L3 glutamine methyltransferase